MTDTVQVEMPKYQCHKKVWALKIASVVRDADIAEGRETDGSAMLSFEEEDYGDRRVGADYVHKHDPMPGGYFVVYEDGYESWSPGEDFERGYALIGK